MAMFLKLEASIVENTKIQSTPGIPDFMDWNQTHGAAVVLEAVQEPDVHDRRDRAGAAVLAFIIGAAMFKRRVGGVYFAIITQAVAAILSILIIGQQGYTGGVNGITDLRTLQGWDIRTDHAKYILYFVNGGFLLRLHARLRNVVKRSKLGPHPGRHARQGRPRPLLRLCRRRLQDIRLLPCRGLRRDRRRDVHAAGRVHVAVIRRHRAVDRDGHLRGGRGPHLDPRRRLRHAARQLGQDVLLRKLPGALALRRRRAVHRVVVLHSRMAWPASTASWLAPTREPAARAAKDSTGDAQSRSPQRTLPQSEDATRNAATAASIAPTDFLLAVEG